MEIICLGFLGGVVFAILVIGIVIGCSENPCERNSDSDNSVSVGDRIRGSDNRINKQVGPEEMMLVLHGFRTYASPYEKRVLDAIVETYLEGEEHDKT